MKNYEIFHDKWLRLDVEQKTLQSRKINIEKSYASLEQYQKNHQLAIDNVNAAMILTQKNVEAFLEEIVTLALQAVFGSNYGFKVEYKIQRNKYETEFYILKDGDRFDPKGEVGGTIIDVVSFALRLAIWVLYNPRSTNVFILDEPGRNISADLRPTFSKMLKEISGFLNIQVVLITHLEEIATIAGTTYQIKQENGTSIIETVYL